MARTCRELFSKDNQPMYISSSETVSSGPYNDGTSCNEICDYCTSYNIVKTITVNTDMVGHDYECCYQMSVAECVANGYGTTEECQDYFDTGQLCMQGMPTADGNFANYVKWNTDEGNHVYDCSYNDTGELYKMFGGFTSPVSGGSGSYQMNCNCNVQRNCGNNQVIITFDFNGYNSDGSSEHNVVGGTFSYSISGIETSGIASSEISFYAGADDCGALFLNGEKVMQAWHSSFSSICETYPDPECSFVKDDLNPLNYLNATVGFANYNGGGGYSIGGGLTLRLVGSGTDTSWFENMKITIH